MRLKQAMIQAYAGDGLYAGCCKQGHDDWLSSAWNVPSIRAMLMEVLQDFSYLESRLAQHLSHLCELWLLYFAGSRYAVSREGSKLGADTLLGQEHSLGHPDILAAG